MGYELLSKYLLNSLRSCLYYTECRKEEYEKKKELKVTVTVKARTLITCDGFPVRKRNGKNGKKIQEKNKLILARLNSNLVTHEFGKGLREMTLPLTPVIVVVVVVSKKK